MTKRALVCAYYARNFGDDLFLKILFDRYPNVKWDLLTANRDYNKIFGNYKNVRILYSYREISLGKRKYNLFYKINEVFLKYYQYSALIIIGGSIFMESPAWKQKFDERSYLINKFKATNKKTFILGANFGPFKENIFLKKYKKLFRDLDDICFRERYSFRLFENYQNVRLAPDIVFNLEYKKVKKEKVVGFSLINLENRHKLKAYHPKYIFKMVEIIKKFIGLGYEIKLFSFCENEGDLKVINQIKNRLDSLNDINELKLVNYEGNMDHFLKEFQSCETIIGTRFHSIILALIFSQNLVPIIYSDKTVNVLNDLSLNRNYYHINEINKMNINDVIKYAELNKLNEVDVYSEAKSHFIKMDQVLI
jgi:colanic acid/amylovoran biosynthesis protein